MASFVSDILLFGLFDSALTKKLEATNNKINKIEFLIFIVKILMAQFYFSKSSVRKDGIGNLALL